MRYYEDDTVIEPPADAVPVAEPASEHRKFRDRERGSSNENNGTCKIGGRRSGNAGGCPYVGGRR
jgi:hypothetical protein